MKLLLALISITSILSAETLAETEVKEVSIIEQSTFTNTQLSEPLLTQPIPVLPKTHRNSFFTVGLSFLAPGLGHVYLGDLKTAGTLFGTSVTSTALASYNDTYAFSNLMSASNTWFYNVYAAYRDVRINNNQAGYTYRMPNDSFSDLASAPFRFSVLKKPEVWGGLIGALTIGGAVSYYAFSDLVENQIECSVSSRIYPLSAFSIGLGEEAFFRGYFQSFLAERLNPTGAIILSSLVFGAVHIPNAMFLHDDHRLSYYTFSLPLITSLGGYMGWLTHKNRSLQSSVALHAWYDFTLFLISAIGAPSASLGRPEFAFSFEF